ncbi:MAG TPA: hypothetical protein VIT68_00760 [Candidatus Gracilibacteria bacterium]
MPPETNPEPKDASPKSNTSWIPGIEGLKMLGRALGLLDKEVKQDRSDLARDIARDALAKKERRGLRLSPDLEAKLGRRNLSKKPRKFNFENLRPKNPDKKQADIEAITSRENLTEEDKTFAKDLIEKGKAFLDADGVFVFENERGGVSAVFLNSLSGRASLASLVSPVEAFGKKPNSPEMESFVNETETVFEEIEAPALSLTEKKALSQLFANPNMRELWGIILTRVKNEEPFQRIARETSLNIRFDALGAAHNLSPQTVVEKQPERETTALRNDSQQESQNQTPETQEKEGLSTLTKERLPTLAKAKEVLESMGIVGALFIENGNGYSLQLSMINVFYTKKINISPTETGEWRVDNDDMGRLSISTTQDLLKTSLWAGVQYLVSSRLSHAREKVTGPHFEVASDPIGRPIIEYDEGDWDWGDTVLYPGELATLAANGLSQSELLNYLNGSVS